MKRRFPVWGFNSRGRKPTTIEQSDVAEVFVSTFADRSRSDELQVARIRVEVDEAGAIKIWLLVRTPYEQVPNVIVEQATEILPPQTGI